MRYSYLPYKMLLKSWKKMSLYKVQFNKWSKGHWHLPSYLQTQTVTARALETMIRLSTAHAKCRLSKTIDLKDAEACIELIQYAYFKKVRLKYKATLEQIILSSELSCHYRVCVALPH